VSFVRFSCAASLEEIQNTRDIGVISQEDQNIFQEPQAKRPIGLCVFESALCGGLRLHTFFRSSELNVLWSLHCLAQNEESHDDPKMSEKHLVERRGEKVDFA
jgi:hypothetical protein